MKNTIKILLSSLVLLLLFPLAHAHIVPVAHAQGAQEMLNQLKADLEPLLSENPMSQCENSIAPLFDAETLAFFEFLETHFQNKSSNSSLLNIALARFKDYKSNIRSYSDKLLPKRSGHDRAVISLDEFDGYYKCVDLGESYIAQAKEKMISHIKTTDSQKKTTAIVEKYQAINDGLRELNFKMAEMYGYFMTFKNKLPFFVSNCVTG